MATAAEAAVAEVEAAEATEVDASMVQLGW